MSFRRLRNVHAAGLCAVAVLVFAPAAPAQTTLPTEGSISLNFTLFDDAGGTALGIWRMMSDRLNLGLVFEYASNEIDVQPENLNVGVRAQQVTWTLIVSPTVKYYLSRNGPVLPFARARIGFGGDELTQTTNEQFNLEVDGEVFRLSASVGLEWFPLDNIGIGGHTGWTRIRRNEERTTTGGTTNITTVSHGTFLSGIEFHIYFH